MSTSWKLVEAEPEPSEAPQSKDFSRRGRGSSRGGRRGGRGGAGRNTNYDGAVYYGYDSLPENYYTLLAIQQIELIFSTDNLAMDTYVRLYMDVEGYVPIALVCNYPNVVCYGIPYETLIENLASNQLLEIDAVNETIRLRVGWEKWLMPNQTGGRGQPKYLKQTIPIEEQTSTA